LTPDCDNCRWSWPIDDPLLWESANAKCRCATGTDSDSDSDSDSDESDTDTDTDIELKYGEECDNITDGDCSLHVGNCDSCRLSWDKNDPLEWNSSSAKCRCVEDRSFFRYGWMCSDWRIDR